MANVAVAAVSEGLRMALHGTKALEAWCRTVTHDYSDKVRIFNMTTSWRNGLGFCAIIHHFRPELIPDFYSLDPDDIYANNQLAFSVAEQHLCVPALLDPQVVPQTTLRLGNSVSFIRRNRNVCISPFAIAKPFLN